MHSTRAHLLNQLTNAVAQLHHDQPTLVAIDGRSAAGKTTLADELAAHVRRQGRPVLRCSIDDFHPPGHKYRSGERRYTPRTYYAEGYDYAAFRQMVLEPLQPRGSRRCRLALWDSFNDAPVPEQWVNVSHDAIVIIDGIFLLRPELQQVWDYAIWLHIGWTTMLERAAQRDTAWVGDAALVTERYRAFWIPAHTLYEAQDAPMQHADVIIDNQNPATPRVISGKD